MQSAADISPSGYYRYSLRRTWGEGRPMAFVMLNPSTADAHNDDPTIRRCINFAKREACVSLIVVNLFAGRATKPDDLFAMVDPVGHRNEDEWRVYLYQLYRPKVVCAWGAEPRAEKQAARFMAWAKTAPIDLWCLGRTKANQPRHPLYLRNDTVLEPYS